MSAVSVQSRSSNLSSGTRQHFGPAYDLSYRFQAPRPFNINRSGVFFRPHTSPESRCAAKYRTDQFQKTYLNAVASAQTSPTTAFRQSLGDGLLMLQSDKHVLPSIFSNLDKMYRYDLEATVPGSRTLKSRLPPSSAPGRNNRRAVMISKHAFGGFTEDVRYAQTADFRDKPSDTVGKIFVEILTKADQLEKTSWKSSKGQLNLPSKGVETGDRCARCSDRPEIQIDGRSMGQNPRAKDEHMSREHCDVLGPSTCPDCIRTKAQNHHLRIRNATTMANATEVYKLALICERIPYLTTREVQRKVYDGEISNAINHVSKWKEIKRHHETSKVAASDQSDQASKLSATSTENQKTRAKLTSSDSIRSLVFKTIPESSETADDQLEESSFRKQDQEHGDGDKDQPDGTIHQEPLFTSNSISADVADPLKATTTFPTQKQVLKTRKVSRKKIQIFNRDLIPSPNYFYNVKDLMERIKKYRRVQRRSAWGDDASQTRPILSALESNEESNLRLVIDEVSSTGSQDSDNAKTDIPPKSFEPPVTFGKKARYLGAKLAENAIE